MDYKIKFDLDNISKKLNSIADNNRERIYKKILDDCTNYVPIKTGKLRESGETTESGIQWTEDYANEVYYKDANHTIGTKEWFEVAKSLHMKEWTEYIDNIISKEV